MELNFLQRAAFEASHVAWGTTVIVGIIGEKQDLSVNPLQFLLGRTIKGSKFGGMILTIKDLMI